MASRLLVSVADNHFAAGSSCTTYANRGLTTMINIVRDFYRNILISMQFLYRIARGLDHKTLNHYILKINQMHDVDSIIYQASRCLYYILDYQLFAFAVYNKDHNSGVDIWVDPKIDNMTVTSFVKKDFIDQNLYYNIRFINNMQDNISRDNSNISLKNILSYKILDNQTRAILYILPRRIMLHYHSELLDTILKTITTAISNFINLKKLESAALIDPLTHCYNRRALDKHIDHDLANTERHDSDLSAVMLDIDDFKKVNDAYGHKAGDAVLQTVSKCVLSAIRQGDYIARFGGEEFIIILPETMFSKAIELAERIRQTISNLRINIADRSISITASFGVALYRRGTDKNALFQKADEMLYEAKKQGKNRVRPDLKLYDTKSSIPLSMKS